MKILENATRSRKKNCKILVRKAAPLSSLITVHVAILN